LSNNSLDNWITLTYDGQRLFAFSPTGTLTAFVASTGRELWSTALGGTNTGSPVPPTAYDGVLYVSTASVGGDVIAVSEADGRVRWDQQVENGNGSSPAVNASGVYVSYDGQEDYRFSLKGKLVWHYQTGLEGGGGSTPAVYSGSVYASGFPATDSPIILSAATGKQTGSFASSYEPAFAGTSMFTINSGDLVASATTGSPVRWTFAGKLDTAPVINHGVVYSLSKTGAVYGRSTASGTKVWTGTVGRATNGPVLAGLAIGGGLLVVPAGSYLTAFGD
jgi:outer membrane protein assembly factor BamB